MLLQGVDNEGCQSIAQWEVHKKNGMLAALRVLKMGCCLSLYNGTKERCHIGSRSWARYLEKLRNIFVTKSANKHPHMQQLTAFCKNKNSAVCIERELGPWC